MPEKICFSLYAFFNPVFSEEGPEEMDSRSMEEEEEEEEEEEVEEEEEDVEEEVKAKVEEKVETSPLPVNNKIQVI